MQVEEGQGDREGAVKAVEGGIGDLKNTVWRKKTRTDQVRRPAARIFTRIAIVLKELQIVLLSTKIAKKVPKK